MVLKHIAGFLLLCSFAFAQGGVIGPKGVIGPSGVVGYGAGGGSTPTVVQVASTTLTTCSAYATNASYTCVFPSNLGSGHYLVALATQASSLATAWNTPTMSGAGCSGVTWTLIGSSTASGAGWISSSTSSGACTLTISNTASGGGSNDAAVVEVSNVTGAITGTPTYASYAYCGTCTGASITTTNANALVLALSVQGGGAFTLTGTFTSQLNAGAYTSSSEYHLVGSKLLTSTGSANMTWTDAGAVGVQAIVAVY